ncbi:hypothetical protein SAMN05421780_11079 [Flexibacter flexilis DSM 6793]|uniref:Uncharacterized protein n=1 Tax=Flexibacter flexilis DSM 6793 TaxID=927664 RepID=A0A1I1MA91_9BACT|nr:hypothetical protein [Flexibacter flexilis]SFC81722.1 hypothetical protein SAMN05421780_11079 [Flexibacter flexilis DSM 6793]
MSSENRAIDNNSVFERYNRIKRRSDKTAVIDAFCKETKLSRDYAIFIIGHKKMSVAQTKKLVKALKKVVEV